MTLTVFLLRNARGPAFTVVCPALPGCISQGETRKEALENIQEAMELFLGWPQDSPGSAWEAVQFAVELRLAKP